MALNPNLFRFYSPVPTKHYAHPAGYKPNATMLKNGVYIADIKPGTRFIASDGKEYKARNLRITRCTDGLREYDLFAYQMPDKTLYIFHAPAHANKLMFTFTRK